MHVYIAIASMVQINAHIEPRSVFFFVLYIYFLFVCFQLSVGIFCPSLLPGTNLIHLMHIWAINICFPQTKVILYVSLSYRMLWWSF